MDYDQEQLKVIAKEFLAEVRHATGWNVEKIVKPTYIRNVQLVAISPRFSYGTDIDDNARIKDNEAQKKLDAFYVVADRFAKKYQGIEFNVAGGTTGDRMANMDKIRMAKELACIAKEVVAISNYSRNTFYPFPSPATKQQQEKEEKAKKEKDAGNDKKASEIIAADKAEGFDSAFSQFMSAMQAMINKYMADQFPTNPKKTLEAMEGGKYIRIVCKDSSRSAWAFVDKTNGDVLKPAGWSAPAKGARANIFQQSTWSNCGAYGPAYLNGKNYGFSASENLVKLAKEIVAVPNSFRAGDIVTGIMGLEHGKVYTVVGFGKERGGHSGKNLNTVQIKDVLSGATDETYDYNLAPLHNSADASKFMIDSKYHEFLKNKGLKTAKEIVAAAGIGSKYKMVKEVKTKSGTEFAKDEEVRITEYTKAYPYTVKIEAEGGRKLNLPVGIAYNYLQGFPKPPSVNTMQKWSDDGIAKSVDGARVELDGFSTAGIPAWTLVVGVI